MSEFENFEAIFLSLQVWTFSPIPIFLGSFLLEFGLFLERAEEVGEKN